MNDGFELAHGSTKHGSGGNGRNHNGIHSASNGNGGSTGSSSSGSSSQSTSNTSTNNSNSSCGNTSTNTNTNNIGHSGLLRSGLGLVLDLGLGAMECLPLSGGSIHQHVMAAATAAQTSTTTIAGGLPTAVVVGAAAGGVTYPHHLNLNPHHQHHHQHLLSHHSPYSNNYPLHHSSSHHHIHSEQTKSLQELQHEVGALLEFRDLVIETFPDLKHKMASMTSSTASTTAMSSNSVGGAGSGSGGGSGSGVGAASVGSNSVGNQSVSSANAQTGGVISSPNLASRRDWEPNIRMKRKLSHKEPSTTTSATSTAAVTAATSAGAVVSATTSAAGAGVGGSTGGGVVATELSSTSLTRSRSNSHSGKKEPKSGENNNGSVVQDSGFSTETSSSKEGHSASSTNGAMTVAIASNRLSCPESDDELLNLLDVIHRKSNRLREEVEHLQNYEREQLRSNNVKTAGDANKSTPAGLTPRTFREHVERLNKEDIKQLRKERDRLLDKLAEMEAETLTGRIKAAKMNDQVEELISMKKDLEEQLKLAMAQKLELSARVQQLQQQQQSKSSSSSQSDFSSQRNFLSSATTVLSTGSGASQLEMSNSQQQRQRANTFQPVVIEHQQHQQQQHEHEASAVTDEHLAFHQSSSSDNKKQQQQQQQHHELPLGRLDGIVSTPGTRNAKCRVTDSKRFSAILLETNVLELQRHLLTLTVQNQVLMQKLESSTKTKTHLVNRLDKSKEDVEDLRFQLEEKNIELEGTKAQLRVLESRIQHSSTPIANSYLHSQNDYETNRSSASTTLMLSRRGASNSVLESQYCGDTRSNTPISTTQAMPPPTVTQISTPSMKAMVHLPMDEIQQHSSSTESAHEHEIATQELPSAKRTPLSVGRLMSTSVGGVSLFEQTPVARSGQQHTFKKFSATASKPSKIPLPGSKAAAYFAGKPPTGRSPQLTSTMATSTAGRSPPSANGSSYGSSRSSLSRSTGNLLSGKSPVSLKRADSAQSIRKDTSNNSLSTNTSRSSTSSSIPLATTPYSSSNIAGNGVYHKATTITTATTPSPRVLQNSPLPKLKRESFTSRVRHLDSLSRAQQQQQQQHQHQHPHLSNSNNSNSTMASNTLAADTFNGQANVTPNSPNVGYLVSSTPKPSSIAAQLNSSIRKDLQFNASNVMQRQQQQQQQQEQQQFTRRAAVAANAAAERSQSVARRFSSASLAGARYAREQQAQQQQQQQHELSSSSSAGSNGSNGGGVGMGMGGVGNGSGAHFASDSDSGKVRNFKTTFLGWFK